MLDPKAIATLGLVAQIVDELRARLSLDNAPLDTLHEEDLWKRTERATIDLVESLETAGNIPRYVDQDSLIKDVLNEALALGPLEDLLADERVESIEIESAHQIAVRFRGELRATGKGFSSNASLARVIQRVRAEIASGSRIRLAMHGTLIVIDQFGEVPDEPAVIEVPTASSNRPPDP